MKRYQYLEIRDFSNSFTHSIDVKGTDTSTLMRIMGEAERIDPGCMTMETKFKSGADVLGVTIWKIDEKGQDILWRIVQVLCLEGWEPFAVNTIQQDNVHFYYHFRRETV